MKDVSAMTDEELIDAYADSVQPCNFEREHWKEFSTDELRAEMTRRLSAPVQPGPRPKCPKCQGSVMFVLLSDSIHGIAVACSAGHRFTLDQGLHDCAAFFPVSAPSAPQVDEKREEYVLDTR